MTVRNPLSPKEASDLIAAATEARTRARAPFSGFQVGAALVTKDGHVTGGCNVESATYGLTVCAERNAVFKAVSEGISGFRAVAVVTGASDPTPPCGACRQVLWDQCGEIEVIMATLSGHVRRRWLSELFPDPFEFEGPK